MLSHLQQLSNACLAPLCQLICQDAQGQVCVGPGGQLGGTEGMEGTGGSAQHPLPRVLLYHLLQLPQQQLQVLWAQGHSRGHGGA